MKKIINYVFFNFLFFYDNILFKKYMHVHIVRVKMHCKFSIVLFKKKQL